MNAEYFDLLDHYLIIRKTNASDVFDRMLSIIEGNVLFSKGIISYILMVFIMVLAIISIIYNFFYFRLKRNILIFIKIFKDRKKASSLFFYKSLRNKH